MCLEKIIGVEGKTPFTSWKGDSNQSSCSGYSNLHHELLQTPSRALFRNREPNKKVLVGAKKGTEENSLGKMGHTLSSKKRRRYGFQGSSQFQ